MSHPAAAVDFGLCSGHGQNGLTAPADDLDGLCTACRNRKPSQWQPAGRPDPGDNQAHKGGGEARRKERLRKLDIYIKARARGLGILDAGVEAGVLDKTAYRYEADRKTRLAAQADGATS